MMAIRVGWFCALLAAAAASATPASISLVRLIANSSDYYGTEVVVRGYTSFGAGLHVYLGEADARNLIFESLALVQLDLPEDEPYPASEELCVGGYAIVRGELHAPPPDVSFVGVIHNAHLECT